MTKNELRKEIEKQVNKYSIHCDSKCVILESIESSVKDILTAIDNACKISNINGIDIFSIGDINERYNILEIKHNIALSVKSTQIMNVEIIVYDARLEYDYKVIA